MKRPSRLSVAQLAKAAKIDLDEALILLWDNGFNEVLDQKSFLSGSDLAGARKLFNIPSSLQIKSLSYWPTTELFIASSRLQQVAEGLSRVAIPRNELKSRSTLAPPLTSLEQRLPLAVGDECFIMPIIFIKLSTFVKYI